MFVIIVERVLKPGETVGPFAHKEQAEAYAREHYHTNVWRVVKLTSPETL
jgi:hypothetical protein